jgi:hypothetical protein
MSTLSRPLAQSGLYERASREIERGMIKRTGFLYPVEKPAAYLEEAVGMIPQIDMLLTEKKMWMGLSLISAAQ